jgi:hypothetical protein
MGKFSTTTTPSAQWSSSSNRLLGKAVLPSGVVRRCLPLAALSPKVDAVVADMVPMGAAVVVSWWRVHLGYAG